MSPFVQRPIAWIIALLIGGIYGVAGTVAQAYAPGGIPVGLLISLGGFAGLIGAMRLLTDDRWAALATGVGALVATFVFSGTGPGGSVIVPSEGDTVVWGQVWMIAVPVIIALGVAWPAPRGGGEPSAP